MQLNHLSLPVRDLDEAEAFFATHLDFERQDRKGDAILVLHDRTDFTLVLSTVKGTAGRDIDYPTGLHVGFFVEGHVAVDEAHGRLTAAGHPLGGSPRIMRGRYGFYFDALGGLLFEISAEA